jgi:hypothetical protein
LTGKWHLFLIAILHTRRGECAIERAPCNLSRKIECKIAHKITGVPRGKQWTLSDADTQSA